jgi:sugar/nucleoside kinase (ribokinase family)
MKRPSNRHRRGIAAAGNFIIDRVAIIDHYPVEETLANVLESTSTNGGPAFNALCDWGKMKVKFPLEAIGLVGTDADGDWVDQRLNGFGVDTRQLQHTKHARTSTSEIMSVSDTGRRTIFHHHGANALFDRGHVDLAGSHAKIFFLAFLALLDRLDRPHRTHGTEAARLLADAREAGMITAADVVSDQSGLLPVVVRAALPHLDVFFCNEIELGTLTGARPRSGTTLDAGALEGAARSLAAGTGLVVVHTQEMAVAVRAGEPAIIQNSVRVPQSEIVGTNGAGDAFAAGFLAALHEGLSVAECLRHGTCVAATSLTSSTPSEGVRTLARCLAFGDRRGYGVDKRRRQG